MSCRRKDKMFSAKQNKKKTGEESFSESESGQEEGIVKSDDLVQHLIRRMHAENNAGPPPPESVRRRIKALRLLQKEFMDIEAKFYSEVHQLECKYTKLYQPLFEKRAQVVIGTYEPTDEECHIPWPEDEEEELPNAVENIALEDKTKNEIKSAEPPMDPNVKGIPDFWLTIFKNVPKLGDMVQEHDEPILKSLQDIKVEMNDEPLGFTLEFHFAPNEYFENSVLTKQYSMKFKPDEEDPLKFEGPEIYACKGCNIDWKKGKNVTVKTIKKKQKHKSRGSVRTVSKTVQADSFFNFFNPPAVPDDPNSTIGSDTQVLLALDFEVGHYIRERVVSRAVLLYTGEGVDDFDEDYEEEEDSCTYEASGTEEISDAED
ncbi:unnamed protein product [Leptosia nina]|uniref:Nucleosome assembly protein 1-like 4 n=1 Tax=Leptosia nina TaxID=320188 RepID=A0AAV1J3L3_9NEOP